MNQNIQETEMQLNPFTATPGLSAWITPLLRSLFNLNKEINERINTFFKRFTPQTKPPLPPLPRTNKTYTPPSGKQLEQRDMPSIEK